MPQKKFSASSKLSLKIIGNHLKIWHRIVPPSIKNFWVCDPHEKMNLSAGGTKR